MTDRMEAKMVVALKDIGVMRVTLRSAGYTNRQIRRLPMHVLRRIARRILLHPFPASREPSRAGTVRTTMPTVPAKKARFYFTRSQPDGREPVYSVWLDALDTVDPTETGVYLGKVTRRMTAAGPRWKGFGAFVHNRRADAAVELLAECPSRDLFELVS